MGILSALGAIGGGLGLGGGSSTTNINTNSSNTSQVGVSPAISVSLGGGINATPASALDASAPNTQRANSQPASSLFSDGLGAPLETFDSAPLFDTTLTQPSAIEGLLPIILLGGGAFILMNNAG